MPFLDQGSHSLLPAAPPSGQDGARPDLRSSVDSDGPNAASSSPEPTLVTPAAARGLDGGCPLSAIDGVKFISTAYSRSFSLTVIPRCDSDG